MPEIRSQADNRATGKDQAQRVTVTTPASEKIVAWLRPASAYTYKAPVGLLEVNMSERPDVNDPLEDDEPVPQTPDEIADDDDDADPLEDDDEEGQDPSTVI